MYGICYVPFLFFRKTACQKYFFQILFQKNAQIVNLKTPDLDLIQRIHPECGFYGFMIRVWICPQKSKIRFWIRKSRFGFSQKKYPKSALLIKKKMPSGSAPHVITYLRALSDLVINLLVIITMSCCVLWCNVEDN